MRTLLLLPRFWGRVVQGRELVTAASLDPLDFKRQVGAENMVVTNPSAPPGSVAYLVLLSWSS